MAVLPRDIADLYLAPVVLAIDARITDLGLLTLSQLRARVGLDGDRADRTRDQREAGLLNTVEHFIDCHEWTLQFEQRGIRISRAGNSVVIGVPATFGQYVSGAN